MTEELRTTVLGSYDEFEAEIVVEILNDAGITAHLKHRLEEGEHSQYPGILDERGIVLVDADKIEAAKRIVAEQLPEHLKSIQEAMAALETGDDVEVRFDNEPEAWEEPERDGE